MPYVSVVIPTYNRLDRLRRVLAGLERQTCLLDRFEVVVVSDGATDGTNEYLRALKTPLNLTLVERPNGGVAAARNQGIARAAGEIVLFIDDDVVPAPQLIAEHLHSHRAYAEEVVVLGPMLTPGDFAMQPWVRWEQDRLARLYADMLAGRWQPTARQFYTGNSSVARRHIIAAGSFDESFKRAEDIELAYRLADRGLRFVFNPDAAGHHYAERSFRSWMLAAYVYGRNDVIFARDKGRRWIVRTVAREFHYRHALTRRLTRACLDRPRPAALALAGMRCVALAGRLLGLTRVSHAAYSTIFNMRYYQGVVDELGGRERFLARLAQAFEPTLPEREATNYA